MILHTRYAPPTSTKGARVRCLGEQGAVEVDFAQCGDSHTDAVREWQRQHDMPEGDFVRLGTAPNGDHVWGLLSLPTHTPAPRTESVAVWVGLGLLIFCVAHCILRDDHAPPRAAYEHATRVQRRAPDCTGLSPDACDTLLRAPDTYEIVPNR